MTLVAAWKEGGTPILIGDIVISSSNSAVSSNFPLPTRDDLNRFLPSDSSHHIMMPLQKVYKISDSFAIGFADSVESARDVVTSTLSRFENSSPSLDEIRTYFTTAFGYKVPSCTIVGWVAENSSIYGFRWRSNKPALFELGDRFVEGTGSIAFASLYSNLPLVLSDSPIGTTLAIIAELIKDEVLYGTNIPRLFGGGFKIIYWDKSKFTVVPSVTFVFLQIEETEDPSELNLLTPKRYLKFHLNGQVLEIMVVRLAEDVFTTRESKASRLAPHEMYYTLPITADIGDTFQFNSNLSLRSQYYCIATDIRLRDKLPHLRNDQFMVISLSRVVADEKRANLLTVKDLPGGAEEFVLEDAFSREVFKLLGALDRNQFKRRHQRARSRRCR